MFNGVYRGWPSNFRICVSMSPLSSWFHLGSELNIALVRPQKDRRPMQFCLRLSPLIRSSRMARVIFHLDMDAFYAAIEQRDQPSLRGKPVIVGSPPTQRGVVCAASYEARKFGVRSAMPSVTAGRLCPKGIFVAPRLAHYREESRAIMALAAQTGAVIEPMSIDEAYLELSALYRDFEADAALYE